MRRSSLLETLKSQTPLQQSCTLLQPRFRLQRNRREGAPASAGDSVRRRILHCSNRWRRSTPRQRTAPLRLACPKPHLLNGPLSTGGQTSPCRSAENTKSRSRKPISKFTTTRFHNTGAFSAASLADLSSDFSRSAAPTSRTRGLRRCRSSRSRRCRPARWAPRTRSPSRAAAGRLHTMGPFPPAYCRRVSLCYASVTPAASSRARRRRRGHSRSPCRSPTPQAGSRISRPASPSSWRPVRRDLPVQRARREQRDRSARLEPLVLQDQWVRPVQRASAGSGPGASTPSTRLPRQSRSADPRGWPS